MGSTWELVKAGNLWFGWCSGPGDNFGRLSPPDVWVQMHVSLTGTIPGEESSPYLYSKAQRLPGSSCNQEGKMDLFPLRVVPSSLASRILLHWRRPPFLSVTASARASRRKNNLELLELDNMKRQRKPSSFENVSKNFPGMGVLSPWLLWSHCPFVITQGSQFSPEASGTPEKQA